MIKARIRKEGGLLLRRLEVDIHPKCWLTLSKLRKLMEEECDVDYVGLDECIEYMLIHSEQASELLAEVTDRWDEIDLDERYKS